MKVGKTGPQPLSIPELTSLLNSYGNNTLDDLADLYDTLAAGANAVGNFGGYVGSGDELVICRILTFYGERIPLSQKLSHSNFFQVED